MSVCEKCWTEASRRAWFTGRIPAEVYREVLDENEGKCEPEPSYCERGPCSNLAGHEGECSL